MLDNDNEELDFYITVNYIEKLRCGTLQNELIS